MPAEDPTEAGPVVEPPPDVPDGPVVKAEIDLAFVEPAAPPVVGPVPIDPSITPPRVIESTKVKPIYPEIGRIVGRPGRVVLQAVILRDGSVAEIEVLQVRPPGLGFEEAAIEAVAQWRYEPAWQNGRPVEVYFTIVVSFDLQ